MLLLQSMVLSIMMALQPYNVFDLSNVLIDHQNNIAYTHESFQVEMNETYTIVIDPDVVGQYYDYMDDEVMQIFDGNTYEFPFLYHDLYDVFYVTFKTQNEAFDIESMPWNAYGVPKIVMYQGSIDDFRGFTVYQKPIIYEYTYIETQKTDQVELGSNYMSIYEEEAYALYQYIGHEVYIGITKINVDLNPPTLVGPSEIMIYSSQEPLTYDDIYTYFQVDESSQLNVIFDAYQEQTSPGKYQMTLEVSNNTGKTTKNITIHVIDNRPPTITLDNHFIETSVFEIMDEQDIYTYIQTYLLSKDIEGQIFLTNNPYEVSMFQSSYEVEYEVISDDRVHQGSIIFLVSSPLRTENVYLYVFILAASLAGIIVFLWIYHKKKH